MAFLPVCLFTPSLFLILLVSTPAASFTSSQVKPPTHVACNPGDSEFPRVVLPGGGLFFYWQAGVVTYLRENDYDLSQVEFCGASAGALTATLTATNVDFYEATNLALQLSEEAGVWDRRGGLQGIWGPMIESWLHELLPEDAVDRCKGRLSLLVTPIPSFGKTRVDTFHTKADLVRCNMASVHLPWFLDGKLTTDFRGSPHIDGSFLAQPKDYGIQREERRSLWLDPKSDPDINKRLLEFVKIVAKEGIWEFLEMGSRFAEKMDRNGDFRMLPKHSKTVPSMVPNDVICKQAR